jgi:transcriptional regulator with XRE-family HTH domain
MPAPHKNPLYKKLRRLRHEKGWSQEQLAEASGVDQATVSALEIGHIKNPSFKVITSIANALGVEAEDILPAKAARA